MHSTQSRRRRRHEPIGSALSCWFSFPPLPSRAEEGVSTQTFSDELYTRVVIAYDLAEHGLKTNDVVTLIDVTNSQNQEPGVTLERFTATGQTIDVIVVPQSAIRPLRDTEVFTVRANLQTVD